jgi:hypothetical protein
VLGHAFLEDGGEQADVAVRGVVAQGFDGGGADAAAGHGDGADEGQVVVLVGDQAQVGAQVLDLGVLEEAAPARDGVGDLVVAQLLLEQARLVVAAVEDRVVLEVGAVLELVGRELHHHRFGLVLGVWQATTVTGSPAPCSDHSFLSKSFSLLAITVLAALRMRVVER